MKQGTKADDIDAYLLQQSTREKAVLQKLRMAIRSVAPDAEELISYAIPCFRQHYLLVGFAAFKMHCSFFPMSKKVLATFKEELESYSKSAGTIRFTVDHPIPLPLVKKIVKFRLAENEGKYQDKMKKKPVARTKKKQSAL